ncbi:hypothetical protein ACFQ1S_14285, partial [Kibdelosporangium lantanae]
MFEQQRVVGALRRAGVIDGIWWACRSAVDRSLDLYSEADGHTPTLLGYTRHTLFCDRLDRVFSCGRYAVSPGDMHGGLDQLYAELSPRDIDTMPELDPALVIRSDVDGSPGWVHNGRRFVLSSIGYGKIDSVRWDRKSVTKQKVARQSDSGPTQPSLFETIGTAELGEQQMLLVASTQLDLPTFVVGHSLTPDTGNYELVLGRTRENADGGRPWRWRVDLLQGPFAGGGRRG